MIRRALLLFVFIVFSSGFCSAQSFIRTADLFIRPNEAGRLTIVQNLAIDTLISRHILSNRKQKTFEGGQGMPGYRIQIYYSSVRSAREESAKTRQEFIDKFPDMISYAEYQEPGWFIVRTGDYRSKTEGYKDFIAVRRVFPNAYLVPATINYPDLKKK
jgi:hypothetical protein